MNYKNQILCFLFLFTFGAINAQTTIPYAAFFSNVDAVSSAGSGKYELTVTLNDQSGQYNGTALDTVNFVFWQDCARYEIDSVLAKFSGQAIIRLNDVDVNGSPNLGQGLIIEESAQGIGFFASGILDSRNQCIASYYTQFIGTSSSSGSADTLYLSDGTMLVNGDTIPLLNCNSERFTQPYDFTDRVVVNNVNIDSVELLDVFVNGVFYNSTTYTVSGDSLIFSSYVIQTSDEVFIRGCQNSIGGINEQIIDSTRLVDGNILVYYQDGAEIRRDTISGTSGGADTLYLSDGTMLVNGDTIPLLDCSNQRFSAPFASPDRIIATNGTLDTFELINVFINGVHYDPQTYNVIGDSLIFNNYSLSTSDTVFLNVCSSSTSSVGQNLNSVLSNGNDAGGLLVKNIGNAIDGGDAVSKSYFEANDSWLGTLLPSANKSIDAEGNNFILSDLGLLKFSVDFNRVGNTAAGQLILSTNSSIATRLGNNIGQASESYLDLQNGDFEFVSANLSQAYLLSDIIYQLESRTYPPDVENIESTNFTAIVGIINQVNVSSAAITVTPPASPSIGQSFTVVDAIGNAFTNNITIDFVGAGQNFFSSSQNYIINLDEDYAEFVYMGASTGWIRKR